MHACTASLIRDIIPSPVPVLVVPKLLLSILHYDFQICLLALPYLVVHPHLSCTGIEIITEYISYFDFSRYIVFAIYLNIHPV